MSERRPPSMRLTVALTVAVFSLLLILAQATALILMFEDKEEEFITDILDQQISHSIALYRATHQLMTPNRPAMQLYRVTTATDTVTVPEALRALAIGDHEIHAGGREYHVAVRSDGNAHFILAYDVEDHEERLRALSVITMSGALLMAVATLLAVYFVSGRLTQRLERLAADVVGGNSGGVYVQSGMEREILVLAQALEALEARQHALLERERGFTAHLGHELRTPLTGIRTDAELISGQPGLPEPVLRRAARIVGAVDRITELASSLLMLAREAQSGLVENVGLATVLAAAWEPLAAEAVAKDVALEVDIPPAASVRCDQALLELVLRNLLDNAVRHSAHGRIACRLRGRVLSVHDCGSGIAVENLPRVFERFFRAGEQAGHGLGLALVRHVCGAAGWVVHAENSPQGGAVFCVDFGGTLSGPMDKVNACPGDVKNVDNRVLGESECGKK